MIEKRFTVYYRRGRWPGHKISKNRCAPFIHSFIVDEWETTNPASPFPSIQPSTGAVCIAKIPSRRKCGLVLSGETFLDEGYKGGIGLFGGHKLSRRYRNVGDDRSADAALLQFIFIFQA
jgi:hypothetical protein